MPELPEVQTVLNGLSDALRNLSITAVICHYEGSVVIDPEVKESPFPSRIKHFRRRGKYILMEMDSGFTLIIHLRMTGKLVVSTDSATEMKHIRASIILQDGGYVFFNDPRTFGKIWLCRNDNVPLYLPKLGVEPLEDGFDAAYLSNLTQRRKTPVKNFLLDQKVVAGLGNIYVSEILFRAGINPERPANSLNQDEINRIVRETKQVLKEAIALNGTSISDFRRIDDKTGEFQNYLRIYQKSHCPEGHLVNRIRQAGRSSFYCPHCQH